MNGVFKMTYLRNQPNFVTSAYNRDAAAFAFWSYTSVMVVSVEAIKRNGMKWLIRKLYRFRRFARRNCGYCIGHQQPLEVRLAAEAC
jgi:hypothetical protein